MGNLIKAQLYQLKRSKLIYLFFILLFIVQFSAIIGSWGTDDTLSGSAYVADDGGAYMALIALIFSLLFTGQVCGADFIDKTSNYEVMSGYKRYDIYISRVIVSLLGGLIGAAVLIFAPLVFFCGVMGWGDTILLSDVVLRCILCLIPILRVSCEIIFLSFVIKNSYIIIALSYFAFVGGQSLMEALGEKQSIILGITNVTGLFYFPSYMTYTTVDLKEFYVYESQLGGDKVITTIIVSLVFGMLALYAGYSYFKKDDLN